jgi:hypothetical protein
MSSEDEPKDQRKVSAAIEIGEESSPVQGLEKPESSVATGSSNPEKQEVSSTEQDGQDAPEDNAAHHVHGIARIILVFGLCATTFIIGLDQMIIATAIPKITTLFKSLDGCGSRALIACTGADNNTVSDGMARVRDEALLVL